jgi:predicted O-methyltransferase YrrM
MYFNLLDERIQQYTEVHSQEESVVLKSLTEFTLAEHKLPQMLSGHLQGLFLKQISWMLRPRLILEIGTFAGYSTICLADGLAEGGKIITIDKNPKMLPTINNYLTEAGIADKTEVIQANAHDWLAEEVNQKKLTNNIDLVFIDADKAGSLRYYERILPMMRKGGFILVDNVLWNGKVCEPIKPNDQETIGLDVFNKTVTKDERVENLLLPFRDGIMMLRVV